MTEQPTATDRATWDLSKKAGRIGTGNWKAFPADRIQEVRVAAATWKSALADIERPWLCWCVDDQWCSLQQRLVLQTGWTPVVGTDGNVAQPTVIPGSVFIDFNQILKLPLMWMHFPLEFAFLYSRRLAFWHSDVLPPVSVMRAVAAEFDTLGDGQFMGVRIGRVGPLWQFRRLLQGKPSRYSRWYEVIGCTTEGASRSQFDQGCGWWRHPEHHPNARLDRLPKSPHWEHGVGIALWEELFGGTARQLTTDVTPFHYSASSSSTRSPLRGAVESKSAELKVRVDLSKVIPGLGLPR
jgi:hypothetical protein